MANLNIMKNPFNVQKLTEKEAINLIKAYSFKYRRKRIYKSEPVSHIIPIGEDEKVRDFLDKCIDQSIFIFGGGIAIKHD